MNFLSAPPKVLNRFGKSLMIVAWSCSNFYIFSFLVLSSFYHYYCCFLLLKYRNLSESFNKCLQQTTSSVDAMVDCSLTLKWMGFSDLWMGGGTICPPSFTILATLIRILWEFRWLQCNLHDLTKKNEVSLVEIEPHLCGFRVRQILRGLNGRKI